MSPEEAYKQIEESVLINLRHYGLWGGVTFIYRDNIRDIDVLSPKYDYRLLDEENDVETVLTLMEKLQIAIPQDVLTRKKDIQRKKEDWSAIKHFENWIVEYFTYLDIGELKVEAVLYSGQQGVLIKFDGINQLFGNPIERVRKKRKRIIRKK